MISNVRAFAADSRHSASRRTIEIVKLFCVLMTKHVLKPREVVDVPSLIFLFDYILAFLLPCLKVVCRIEHIVLLFEASSIKRFH